MFFTKVRHFSSIGKIDRSAFLRDGYIVVRQLIPQEVMKSWKAEIDADAAARAAQASDYLDPSTGRNVTADTSGVTVWFPDEVPKLFENAFFPQDGPFAEVLQTLIGPNVEFLSAKPVLKTGAIEFASPWHQDWLYWRGSNKISSWVAIDDTDETNACLRVVPGSHTQQVEHDGHEEDIGFDQRATEEAIAEHSIEENAISVPLKSGDAIFFHDLLLHASHSNVSGRDRYSIIPTFRDSQVVDDSTIWNDCKEICGGKSVNKLKV
eukprot:g3516.t1